MILVLRRSLALLLESPEDEDLVLRTWLRVSRGGGMGGLIGDHSALCALCVGLTTLHSVCVHSNTQPRTTTITFFVAVNEVANPPRASQAGVS